MTYTFFSHTHSHAIAAHGKEHQTCLKKEKMDIHAKSTWDGHKPMRKTLSPHGLFISQSPHVWTRLAGLRSPRPVCSPGVFAKLATRAMGSEGPIWPRPLVGKCENGIVRRTLQSNERSVSLLKRVLCFFCGCLGPCLTFWMPSIDLAMVIAFGGEMNAPDDGAAPTPNLSSAALCCTTFANPLRLPRGETKSGPLQSLLFVDLQRPRPLQSKRPFSVRGAARTGRSRRIDGPGICPAQEVPLGRRYWVR